MKTSSVWFEFPHGVLEFFIRFLTIFISLVVGSYLINQKVYIIPNLFVCSLLTCLYTDNYDSFAENLLVTVVYSSLIGLFIYGYHFFRLYTPMCIEVYKFTGQGVLLTMLSGIVGYLSTYHYRRM